MMWLWSGGYVEKRASDQGSQRNSGPHQDPIFDNPSALCLAVWAKHWIRVVTQPKGPL